MSYTSHKWKLNNPEKRKIQKRREYARSLLRKNGVLPPVGEGMNEYQKEINDQISRNDFSSVQKYRKIKEHKKNKSSYKKPYSLEFELWLRAKQNSKNKNLEFNLEIEDIKIPKKCPYLNVELTSKFDQNTKNTYISIDRIDSTKGYIKDNIRIISLKANTMKNDASNEQLIIFAKNVLKLHKK